MEGIGGGGAPSPGGGARHPHGSRRDAAPTDHPPHPEEQLLGLHTAGERWAQLLSPWQPGGCHVPAAG